MHGARAQHYARHEREEYAAEEDRGEACGNQVRSLHRAARTVVVVRVRHVSVSPYSRLIQYSIVRSCARRAPSKVERVEFKKMCDKVTIVHVGAGAV